MYAFIASIFMALYFGFYLFNVNRWEFLIFSALMIIAHEIYKK